MYCIRAVRFCIPRSHLLCAFFWPCLCVSGGVSGPTTNLWPTAYFTKGWSRMRASGQWRTRLSELCCAAPQNQQSIPTMLVKPKCISGTRSWSRDIIMVHPTVHVDVLTLAPQWHKRLRPLAICNLNLKLTCTHAGQAAAVHAP